MRSIIIMIAAIVMLFGIAITTFTQTNIATKLQMERLQQHENPHFNSIKILGYITEPDRLYFEFADMAGNIGKGYITKNAELINFYIINKNDGRLLDVGRSKFYSSGRKIYTGVSNDKITEVNNKYDNLYGRRGSLSAFIGQTGNLDFEFITNDGEKITTSIINAVGIDDQ